MPAQPRCEAGCGRRIVTWWDDDHDRDWLLCGVCNDRHADALVAQGWKQVLDDRDEDEPEPVAVDGPQTLVG